MNFNTARNVARKLANTENKPYAIWIGQSIYQTKNQNREEQYIVKPYISYDQYREGFVEFVSATQRKINHEIS